MIKNILIVALVIFSLGSMIFAIYNKKIAENSLIEAANQREKSLEFTQIAEESFLRQKNIAEQALKEADFQRKRAEEALNKCQ
jgi:hypothetical protein